MNTVSGEPKPISLFGVGLENDKTALTVLILREELMRKPEEIEPRPTFPTRLDTDSHIEDSNAVPPLCLKFGEKFQDNAGKERKIVMDTEPVPTNQNEESSKTGKKFWNLRDSQGTRLVASRKPSNDTYAKKMTPKTFRCFTVLR